MLDERRKSDQPFIDGIEISQKNQTLIKFGYITTKDKRYIIEIGLQSEDFAVCFLDLDRFKLVNDYLGHQKGDALLSSVGKTMKGIVENGTVYRLGGDEFMIIFTNVTREEVFEQVKHVLVGVEKELTTDKYYEIFQLSASAGIAFGEPDDTVTSIKTKVDVALQQAKLKGKNQYQVYEVSENTGDHNS